MSHSDTGNSALLAMALIAVLLTALYLAGVRYLYAAGRSWKWWSTVAFVLGMVLVILSLLPPVAEKAHHDIGAHMLQHLLLGMFGPIGIVLGRPVTLVLISVPPTVGRRLIALLRARPVHLVSHPAVALILNIGGMGVLYLTPLYAALADSPGLHVLVHLHFILAGCLFSWAVLALEPAAAALHRSAPVRLGVLFLAIALHAGLAKSMYAYRLPRGTTHDPAEIAEAAKLMYYGGDLSELVLAALLCATWSRSRREPRRVPQRSSAHSWLVADLPPE